MTETANLAQRLAGLLDDAPHEHTSAKQAPWYVHLLLAFCGWLAALFILSFISLALSSIIDSKAACALLGSMMLAGVYWLLKHQESEFTHHIGLAFSVAAQGLLIYGLSDSYDWDHSVFWLFVFAIEMVLMWLMPSFLHSISSACLAGLSFCAFLGALNVIALANPILLAACIFVWLKEFSGSHLLRKIQGIGYGFVLALIISKVTSLASQQNELFDWLEWNSRFLSWLDEGLTVAVFLGLVAHLLRRYDLPLKSSSAIKILVFATVLCVGSFFAQGVTAGMAILILGFSSSNRKLMILGGAALVYYVSNYYYNLDTTLLHKAYSFAFLGAILLALRLAWSRMNAWSKELYQ